jgi:hypothetical protein
MMVEHWGGLVDLPDAKGASGEMKLLIRKRCIACPINLMDGNVIVGRTLFRKKGHRRWWSWPRFRTMLRFGRLTAIEWKARRE